MATDHNDLGVRWNVHGDGGADSVTLTSGVENYAAVVGAGGDIEWSTNRSWTLDRIRAGLAIALPSLLGIVPADNSYTDDRYSAYYDDNYDGTSSQTVHERREDRRELAELDCLTLGSPHRKVVLAKKLHADRSMEIDTICKTLRISRSTFYRDVRL
jgi:hypothetical protein